MSFLLCLLVVLYGILQPVPSRQLFVNSDKIIHVLAFICLALTARIAVPQGNWIWLVIFCLAPLLEYLQGQLSPLRSYSLEDGYANVVGVLIALIFVKLHQKYQSGSVRSKQ
ncbi:hypothetical protein BGP75_24945 [Motiliproteus sp. MSK22-1]|nr:hypothetical protein BGP75_24945 [Motiliproteus sp. MSK22-1]